VKYALHPAQLEFYESFSERLRRVRNGQTTSLKG
jgi:hypothetical protein